MRIVVVHNLPPGGARRRLAGQMGRLDADIIGEVCLDTATPITEQAHRVSVRRLSPSLPRLVRPPLRYLDHAALLAAWRRVAAIVAEQRPDVVFLNPCRFLGTPPIAGHGPAPVVYFCDEPRRVDSEPGARARLSWPMYAPVYRAERRHDREGVAACTSIATNSAYSAGEILRVYARHAQVVRMGVEPPVAATPRPREPFVLSVGTLIPGKGHEIVVAAAAQVDRPVRIVAPRPNPLHARRLADLARSLAVALQIRVAISDTELAELYESAFAVAYMARREPLGLVSLEAQAHGCPVVVADEGGLPETIQPNASGLTSPRTAPGLAAALTQLNSPARHDRMSRRARAHAATFTWAASAMQMRALFNEALTPGR